MDISHTKQRFLIVVGCAALVAAVSGCSSTPAASSAAGADGTPAIAMVGGDGSFARVVKDGLRICTTNDAPYNVKNAAGKFEGVDADIINEAVSRLGITNVSYVEGPWDSMVPNLQSGRCDLLQTNIHYNDKRAAIIDFTVPAYFYADFLVVQKGNPLGIHTWEDMAAHSSSAMLGDNYVDWLNARGDLSAVKTYKTWPELISDVENGRVDSAIVDEVVASYYVATHPDTKVELATDYVPQTDMSDWTRFGVQKGDHDLANAFSNTIDQMRVDGTVASVLAKYGIGKHAVQVFKGMQ